MTKYLNFYKKSKKSKKPKNIDIRRSGNGYIKRRMGLLSNEIEKMIEKDSFK